MKDLYILYKGDAWLSASSLEAIAVFNDKRFALRFMKRLLKEKKITQDDYNLFAESNQTQGNDVNYLMDLIDLNPL